MSKNQPNGNTAVPDPLSFPQAAATYSTQVSSGQRTISGIVMNKVVGGSLLIYGDAVIEGRFLTPIIAAGGIQIPAGSPGAPGLSVIGDPFVGLYSPALGQLAVTINGAQPLTLAVGAVQVAAPITTMAGNLILNPAGGAVDFSGKAIINFSGFSANPNYYDVVAPVNVTTVGAVTAVILSVATAVNAVYTLTANVSCLSTTDGMSACAFIVSVKAKNIGGVLTIGVNMETNQSRDLPLVGCSVVFAPNGTTIDLTAVGTLGHTISWWGAVKVQRMLL